MRLNRRNKDEIISVVGFSILFILTLVGIKVLTLFEQL